MEAYARAALRDAPQAEPVVPDGFVLVPESALRWLFGKEGEFVCPPENYSRGKEPPFWWRSVFRAMLAARPSAPTAVEPDERAATETQAVLIEVVEYTVPMPVAAEMPRLHMDAIDDAERLNWIELAATRRKVEIARSILGAGYEIGEWPSMRVTVKSGTLRQAIDAARASEGTL